MTGDERRTVLDQELAARTAGGWRIENRSDFQATVARGKGAGRRTVGLGALGLLFGKRLEQVLLTVDEAGQVSEQQVG